MIVSCVAEVMHTYITISLNLCSHHTIVKVILSDIYLFSHLIFFCSETIVYTQKRLKIDKSCVDIHAIVTNEDLHCTDAIIFDKF